MVTEAAATAAAAEAVTPMPARTPASPEVVRADAVPASVQFARDSNTNWTGVLMIVLWGAGAMALLVRWRGWRPGVLDGPAWRPTIAGGLAMAVVMILAGIIGAGLGRVVGQVALGTALIQIVVAAFIIAMRRQLMSRSECHPSAGSWSVLGGVVGLIVAWPIVQLASMFGGAIYAGLFGGQSPMLQHESLRQLQQGGLSAASMAIIFRAVIAAPFIEEVLYRGVIQQTMRSGGVARRTSIVFTSALFAVMHLGEGAVDGPSAWSALPALFVLSLFFGVLFERTGRLAAPMVAHALFNLANILLLASGISS